MTATTNASVPAATGSVRHPLDPSRRIRAVLFDLDGTLYRQSPVRALMAAEMLTLPLTRPLAATAVIRALRSYRHAQEDLRGREGEGSIATAQIARAAEDSGLSHADVEAIVTEWMIERPLKYLGRCILPGVSTMLEVLDRAGVRTGLLSDYPAVRKLEALGLAGRFSPVLCASDREINRFKPDPRGFLVAADGWGLPASEVLMVGDRYEVDCVGARAAGMPCVLIGKPKGVPPADATVVFSSFERLARVIDHTD